MKRPVVYAAFAAITLSAVALSILIQSVGGQEMAFGGKEDIAFANKVWKSIAGYDKWLMKSDVYPGESPHGKFLRLYYNMVNVDGKPYHIIIKDNFGGKDATLEKVSKSPEKYLAAVTVMVQREAGYDSDNNDWFWVKYKADGAIDKNPKGMALAGRVGKGMDEGCIPCHSKAKDNDYLFTNDETAMSINPEKLLQERCTLCHNLDRVHKAKKDSSGWQKTIARMAKRMPQKGAKINEAEQKALIDYLSKKSK
ncbi:MAG: cytochrome P460 family protein [Candidatus Poribacteria bacterium]